MDIEKRWGIDGYNYRTQYVYRAIIKYGWGNIEHNIIKSNLTKDEACETEKYLIALYHSNNAKYGYNCTSGGDSLYVCSDETRDKLRKSHLGKPMSEKCKQALYLAHKGIPRTEETKNKISKSHKGYYKNNIDCMSGEKNPFYGKHHSEKAKELNRQKHIGKSSGHTYKTEIINQKTDEHLYFNKQGDVAKFLNVSQALVSNAISNNKNIKNFIIRRYYE